MRFHRLEVENLNSLYGPQVIDFDSNFADASLLLIHGDTGAGKSTILDAIHLALFGTTPRLRAGRGDDATNPNHIMSRNTGFATVRLEFSVVDEGKRTRYRAGWSLHRARKSIDGAFQNATRQLERWNHERSEWESVAASNQVKGFTAAFNEALMGLTAEDFQRCVLLAQGRFDALLSATKDERKNILQRVIDVTKFKEIGAEVARRSKLAKDNLTSLRERLNLGTAELLSDEDRDALTRQIALLSESVTADRKRVAVLQAREDWTMREREFLSALNQTLREIEDVDRRFNELNVQRERLAQHDRLEPLAKLDAEIRKLSQQLETYASILANQSLELNSAKIDEATAKEKLAASEDSLRSAKKERDEREPELKAATAAREDYAIAKQRRNEAEKAFTHAADEYNAAKTAKAAAELKRENLQSERETVEEKRAKIEISSSVLSEEAAFTNHYEQLKVQYREFQRASKALDDVTIESQTALKKLIAKREELEGKQSILRDVEAKLFALAESSEPSALDAIDDKLRKQIEAAQGMLRDLVELRKLRLEQRQAQEAHQKDSADVNAVESELLALQNAFEAADAEEKSLVQKQRDIQQLYATAAEFLTLAHKLKDHEPCPLCGSESHVASDARSHALAESKARLEQQLEELQAPVERAIANRETLARRLGEKREVRASVTTRHTTSASVLQKVEASLAELLQRPALAPYNDASLEDLLSAVEEAETQTLTLQRTQERAVEMVRQRRELVVTTQRLEAEMLAAADVSSDLAKRVLTFDMELRTRRAEYRESIVAGAATLAKVGRDIDPIDSFDEVAACTVVGKAIREVLDQIEPIRALESELQRIQSEDAKIQAELGHLSASAEKTLARREALKLALDEVEKEVLAKLSAVQGFFGGRDPDLVREELRALVEGAELAHAATLQAFETARKVVVEKEQAVVATTSAIQTVRESQTQYANELQSLLKEHQLNDIEALRAARLSAEEAAELRPTLEAVANEREQAHSKAKFQKATLDTHRQSVPEGGPADENVLSQITQITQQIDSNNIELGQAQQKITQDNERRARIASAQEEIENARLDVERWAAVHEIAGEKNGDRFVEFALALCMGELIQYANMNLRMLSSRYELRQLVEAGGTPVLDFEIVDLEQGGAVRPTSTLSGGERFILSLSLALGLGNTVRSRLRFETLMIDEGFGTLDADTLRKVIATLGDLQLETGAQVMLISHVEMLAERIPDQIHVKKIGGGRSQIVTRTQKISA